MASQAPVDLQTDLATLSDRELDKRKVELLQANEQRTRREEHYRKHFLTRMAIIFLVVPIAFLLGISIEPIFGTVLALAVLVTGAMWGRGPFSPYR